MEATGKNLPSRDTDTASWAGTTAEAMQQQIALMAGMLLPQFQGRAAGAQEVTAAVSAFLATPKTLSITARSAECISMLEAMAAPDVLQKVEFTAKANE